MIDTARLRTLESGSELAKPDPARGPIAYYVDFDGYYFVSYAREIARGQGPRIRSTRLDAAPNGRPVHWSSAFPWWLVAIGSARAVVGGEPVEQAIERAAYVANPVLMALTLALLSWALWRSLGPAPAALATLAFATHPQLLLDFGYAKPDHHGLHLMFATGLLVCAGVAGGGWLEGRSAASARRWMRASGVFGGLGLWAGATQSSVMIAALGGGAAVACWYAAREPAERFDPLLWRGWARAGALTSLVAFALEYAPSVASLRLEVNHPLYALAWLGGGEALVRLGRLRRREPGTAPALGLALVCAALLPAAVAFGPDAWFWPKDRYMLNLHQRIGEFAPFFDSGASAASFAQALGAPVFGALAALFAVRTAAPASRGRAALALVPCLVLGAWFIAQARWFGWFSVTGISALAWSIAASRKRPALRTGIVAATLVIVTVQSAGVLDRVLESDSEPARPATDAAGMLALDRYVRDLAINLCPPDPHRGPVRVMTGPSEAARMHFFGRCRGVGTPFWENRDGVRATADFFTAHDDSQALQILDRHQIDYVVLANSAPFVQYMHLTRYGVVEPERVAASLGQRMLGGHVPDGLKAVQVPGWPAARNWRIYRVSD